MLTTLLNLLRKKAPQTIEIPIEDLIPESGSCSVKIISLTNGLRCRECWQDVKPKGRKTVPTVLCPTSLTWDAIPSWRLRRLWSHCWFGVGSTQPGRVPYSEHFFKVYCVQHVAGTRACHQGPKEFQGKIQLISTSPGAGDPSSSLLPESAAS